MPTDREDASRPQGATTAQLVHLSDLHFGTGFSAHLGEVILKEIQTLAFDAVVVSGDFTLRARHHEYQQAREFLDRIGKPTLTIPGNHDQPLYAPFERLIDPYRRYRQYICSTLDSALAAKGLYLVGLSDCHPVMPGGFWGSKQRRWIAEQLMQSPRGSIRVVASHHQFVWAGKWRPAGFWYPTSALNWLAQHGVELVLNGHTHVPRADVTPSGVVISRAGTATSDRTRNGWSNSYNLIAVAVGQISVSVRQYDREQDAFVEARVYTFPRRVIPS